MPVVPPIVPPAPLAVAVPTGPAARRARDPQAVKTQTARAIGSVRETDDARNDTRQDRGAGTRGDMLDTTV